MMEFYHPEVPLCHWQDIRIQLLTNELIVHSGSNRTALISPFHLLFDFVDVDHF